MAELLEYIAVPIELSKQAFDPSLNFTDSSFSLSTIVVIICVRKFRTDRISTWKREFPTRFSISNCNSSMRQESMNALSLLINILNGIWTWSLTEPNNPSNTNCLAASGVGNITFISLDDEEMIWEMSLSDSPAFAIVLVDSLPISVSLRFSFHESIFFQSSSTISSLATRIRRSGQMFGGSIAPFYDVNNPLFFVL